MAGASLPAPVPVAPNFCRTPIRSFKPFFDNTRTAQYFGQKAARLTEDNSYFKEMEHQYIFIQFSASKS
jgi:hypothetical protein